MGRSGNEHHAHADRLRTVSDEFAGTELERIAASAPQKVGFQEAIAVRDVVTGAKAENLLATLT